MNILFLYDFPLWGSGSGTYLRFLSKELVKKGHKVGIISPDERRLSDNIKQYKAEPPQTPVFVGHPELKGAKRYSELSPREITDIYKSYLDTTLEAVNNFKPDVIHVNHLSMISWVARYIYALMDVKYIITVHGSCLSNIIDNKKYLPQCEDAIRHSKAVTMVSKDTKDRFFDVFKEDCVGMSRIIPGGVHISNFPQKVDVSHIEEKYDIKGKKVVLFTGRITAEKGVEYLIAAASKIKGEIFIAGEGPKKKELESMMIKKNISNVHFLGYLLPEELIPFYYRADVFVSPSIAPEAFGLVILEAMAARTPVIATAQGAIPLLVKNGRNGLFVKVRNSTDIAEKCNKLLERDELRKKLGENARQDIEEKFTWEKIAERFETLYKVVTGDYRKDSEGENYKNLHKLKKGELIKKAIKNGVHLTKEKMTREDIIKLLKKKQK